MNRPDHRTYRLGDTVVDPAGGTVVTDRGTQHVEPRLIAVLGYLVSRKGQVVSRRELLADIWSTTEAYDESLTQAVSKLRAVLGDSARSPAFIETIPKTGYRFIGDVTWGAGVDDDDGVGAEWPDKYIPPQWRWSRVAVLAFILLTAMIITWQVAETDPDPDVQIEDMEFDDPDL